VIIRGQVQTGLGKASGQTKLSLRDLTRALGVTPVPGTLNVRLAEGFVAPTGARPIRIDRIGERDMPFFLFAGHVGTYSVWVTRSLSQMQLTDDSLELLSTVHLRTVLGIQDGDIVTIDLEE